LLAQSVDRLWAAGGQRLQRLRLLERDPEKWVPVFRKRSCSKRKPNHVIVMIAANAFR
jgi:hypothetical protein